MGAAVPVNSVYGASVSQTIGGSQGNNRWAVSYRHNWNVPAGAVFSADSLGQSNFLLPLPDSSDAAGTGATSATDVLYLQQPGGSAAIDIHDVNQGQIGDCFLLACVADLALYDPNTIMNMIHANADGTETVTLYTNSDGSLVNISTYQPPSSTATFRPVSVNVDNVFPADAVNNNQPAVNGQTEIWVQALEEAVATLYAAGGPDSAGYAVLNKGGFSLGAMEVLTGLPGTSTVHPTISAAQLTSDMAAGDLITVATTGAASKTLDLVDYHEYALESITTVNGTPMVQLYNPWGNPGSYWVPGSPTVATANTPGALPYQPAPIPLASLITYLDTYAGGYGQITVSPPPSMANTTPNFSMSDQTTQASSGSAGDIYSGPVAGLTNEMILATPDNINVTSNIPNIFISLDGGTGEDAINASVANGNNVLNGSTGSSFLQGGTGNDTFYVDDRAATANIWSTVAGFHSGDNATIWGITAADFAITTADNEGAAGFTGLTWDFSAAGKPDAKLSLAGYTKADLTDGKLNVIFGTTASQPGLPGSDYMLIHAS